MKTAFQLVASAVALTGLLFGAAAQATNLSELPLKASIFAKPNVIFGMDDSGSMDSELMLYNNDGAFWWDFTAGSGWGVDAAHPNASLRTITGTWFNAVGDASSRWRKMVYLVPNGTGAGNRIYADDQNDHFAIMPTTQFAFLRWSGVYRNGAGAYVAAPSSPALSPVHNPLYYNPMVTYSPWARAQLSTGAVTPVDATTTSVKSHPINGSFTFNLTTDVSRDTGSNRVFTAFPGMRVPSGAQKNVCSSSNGGCAGWVDVTATENAAAGSVTRVAMPYYPATYWVKETCTPENTSLTADTCTAAPDGSTLKRYEIKSTVTSYPSGRTYAAEMQNFANWFQYFRKRRMMLAAAMGETMENITGLRMGVVPFNSRPSPATNLVMYDADSTISGGAEGRKRVAGFFYQAEGNGGTPTRETLKYIGEQFARTDKDASGRYNMVQFSCQRNNAFIVTDGFATASTPAVPIWDSGKSAATWGAGVPYATTYDNTLADFALRFFTNNPRPAAATDGLTAGALPTTATDLNDNLHMNTYGLTLGARGTLFLGESSPQPTSAADWPNPSANRSPTSVDDLWHATINGRGKMYLANTPEETAARVQSGLADILDQVAAQGGIAVSAVNLDRSDRQAYLGVYNRNGWQGDLTANPIDINTAAVTATPNWSAATVLRNRDWTTRVIFTAAGTSGEDFAESIVGATVNPDITEFPSNQPVVDYLRGKRTGEGTDFRTRLSLIGAVVSAEPVLARDPGEQMVYIASGEGMLHALDTATGNEHWAFVPPAALTNMGKSVQRGWVYQTLLDATPAYARLSNGRKMLIGGMGAAGRSYYALDVTSPRNLTTAQAKAQFKWTFPANTDSTNIARMGYTVSKPVIARVNVSGSLTDVVLVTSGYDNGLTIGDGKGRLWMLNATTGAVIKTFRTTAGTTSAEAGLAHVSAFRESDGSTRYVFGGDLLGNIWRFDLALTGGGDIDGEVLATLRDSTGRAQPVTASPELATIGGRRMVMIGTGRILDIGDFGNANVQSFYVIADGSTLSNARTALTSRTFTRGGTPELSGAAIDWSATRGWYFDLPAGEHANTDPVVAYGSVAFVTNVNGSSNCAQSSFLYLVDINTGDKVSTSTFVSQTIAANAASSRVIALRVVNGRIIGTTHRSDNTVYQRELPVGQTITPAKNAWREIRR